MSEVQRRIFPEAFKREAVERVRSGGLSAGKVAAELGLHETVLRRWMRQSAAPSAAASLPRPTAQVVTPSLADLAAVTPMHVAGYVEQLGRIRSKPTVKQHLAAIRMLFDWLIAGQVVASNPAQSVHGPEPSVKEETIAVSMTVKSSLPPLLRYVVTVPLDEFERNA